MLPSPSHRDLYSWNCPPDCAKALPAPSAPGSMRNPLRSTGWAPLHPVPGCCQTSLNHRFALQFCVLFCHFVLKLLQISVMSLQDKALISHPDLPYSLQTFSRRAFPEEQSCITTGFSLRSSGVTWSSKAAVCKRCIHCITIGVKFLCTGLFIFQSAALSWDFWAKLVALGSFEASQVEGFVCGRFTSRDLLFSRFISLLLHMYSGEGGKKLLLVKCRVYFPCGMHAPKKNKNKNCVKNCSPWASPASKMSPLGKVFL